MLAHDSFTDSLATTLGKKLGSMQTTIDYGAMAASAYDDDPELVEAAAHDLFRWSELDPAAAGHDGFLRIFLFFKGFHCVQGARVAHHFYTREGGGGRMLACALQSEMADTFGVGACEAPSCLRAHGAHPPDDDPQRAFALGPPHPS